MIPGTSQSVPEQKPPLLQIARDLHKESQAGTIFPIKNLMIGEQK
jgi:hypothetical protein